MYSSISSFRVFYFTYYLYLAMFVGFTIPYLKSLGYSSTGVGIFMSIIYLFSMFGNFLIGYICDLKSTIKKVFIVCIIILTAQVFLLFKAPSAIFISLCLCVIGLFQSPSFSMLDCWVLENKPSIRDNFGYIRAFGSIGWGLSTLIMGKVIDNYGYNIIPITFVCMSFLVLFLANKTVDVQKQSHGKVINITEIKELLSNKRYLHLIMIYLLVYIAFNSNVLISNMLLNELSGKAFHIGVFAFIASWSEIPILLGARRLLVRFDIKKILIFSALFFVIRGGLTYFATNATYVIVLSLLQMPSFGIFIFISRFLVDEISSAHLKTSSQTIITAVSVGLSGLLSFSGTGLLIDTAGMGSTIIISTIVAVLALILSISYYRNVKSESNAIAS